MYLEHFHLRERPFLITPDTDFYFNGSQREALLDDLFYAALHEDGIVKVTGEVGSGKTMLCRMLINRLPADIRPVYLSNPSLERNELLYALATELGIAIDERGTNTILRSIEEQLIEIFAQGQRVLLIVDEAHAMPVDSLETIRLLSNLESDRNRLLRIMLYGQKELTRVLRCDRLRPLRERVTQQIELPPLRHSDIGQYITFRMKVAGIETTIFSDASIRLIAKASLGLFRRINILCDKALLAAFTQGATQVDGATARLAIRDARFQSLRPLCVTDLISKARSGAIVVAMFAGGMFSQTLLANRNDSIQSVGPMPAGVVHTTVAQQPAAPVNTAPRTVTPTLKTAATPVANTPKPQPVPSPIAIKPARATEPIDLAAMITETEAWLATANPDDFALQLLFVPADNNEKTIQDFVQKALAWRAANDMTKSESKIRVYKAQRGDTTFIGVVDGAYATQLAARNAHAKTNQYFPQPALQTRTVLGLKNEIAKG
jgi:MSHA biogenesis protein MshM